MDFVILKVNGVDVTNLSQEETIETLLSAVNEPIIVEVIRRKNKPDACDTEQNNQKKNNGDQTGGESRSSDPCVLFNDHQARQRTQVTSRGGQQLESQQPNCHPPIPKSGTMHLQTYRMSSSEKQGLDQRMLMQDLEYEEILLRRNSNEEKLGMTLCYETDADDGSTEIFIDDIHPEGLAARDGRLELGDQIIQIDGDFIRTKAEAQEKFLLSEGDVSLLVARPPAGRDQCHFNLDNLLEGELIDKDLMSPRSVDTTKSSINSYSSINSNSSKNGCLECKDSRNSTSSSKDSGHCMDSNTTNSSKSTKSQKSPDSKVCLFPNNNLSTKSKSSESFGESLKKSNSLYSIDKDFHYLDKKQRELAVHSETKFSGEQVNNAAVTICGNDPIYETIPEASESESMVYCLPYDNCQLQKNQSPENKQPNLRSKSSDKLKNTSKLPAPPNRHQKLSRSTSLNKYDTNIESHAKVNEDWKDWKQKEVENWIQKTKHNSPVKQNRISLNLQTQTNPSSHLNESTLSLVISSQKEDSPADIVYTNAKNLEKTIKLQQQELLNQLGSGKSSIKAPFHIPPPPKSPPYSQQSASFQNGSQNGENWEWKVKIRPDGTRYITKRPIRNKLLKERALKIQEKGPG